MNVLSTIFAPFIAVGVMLGTLISPVPEPQVGASEAVPKVVAFFETTLASGISANQTSFTLTSATDKDGNTLASSTYAFVIDEGSANEEIVIADCTGTACINALRGVSAVSGNTEVTALKKLHRRGATVKITDAPILMLVSRAMRGEDVTNFTPVGNGSLVDKQYVDGVALGSGAVPATYTDDGILELATGTQAASSTATDQSGSPLALHTGISTSTAPTSGAYVVVTGQDGDIDVGMLPFDIFGDGSDGTVEIPSGSTTTLTRDMYYENLAVNGVLLPDGFVIYVKDTISGTGTIKFNGNGGYLNYDDGACSTYSECAGGLAGTSTGSGRFRTIEGAAGNAVGATTYTSITTSGTSTVGSTGGRSGGNDSQQYDSGKAGGTGTKVSTKIGTTYPSLFTGYDFGNYNASNTWAYWRTGGQAGGGATATKNDSGSCSDGNIYGKGGGGGASGGVILILAQKLTGTFGLEAKGGVGGQGGDGNCTGSISSPGGGGGGGGSGGAAVLVFRTSTWTGSATLTGGAGGQGGTGEGGSYASAASYYGATGTDGTLYEIDL